MQSTIHTPSSEECENDPVAKIRKEIEGLEIRFPTEKVVKFIGALQSAIRSTVDHFLTQANHPFYAEILESLHAQDAFLVEKNASLRSREMK